ncbi:urease accessory protein UreD [Antarcticimicrobium luteum]|uniref:Urease accessory protein UreD n=1 Tax=Antarcticimicrobium luteum TaxID=2547397 RepID=A0A4R5V0Q3_9RHOB|nr:urease accessory protein UreD [Antarcticimicrobium luteum]TDK45015.1 urease accessory protein UreD [Antarcticimicrobium luteum]
MTSLAQIDMPLARPVQPRAEGALHLSSKRLDARSVIDGFRCSGAMKALFPRSAGALEAIMINSSGGLTGGDRIAVRARAGRDTDLTLTTQAAERAYRASDGVARVETRLEAAAGARLSWLPQELILFRGASLDRSLRIELAADARLLMVEPVLFGRGAMGEVLDQARLRDRIEIRRDGRPLYRDATRLEGDLAAQLARPGIAGGCAAIASLVFIDPAAEAHLDQVRALLPETGGASLLHPDLLAVRLLAHDGFELRRHLLPILDRLSGETLPTSWRL